MVHLCKVIAFHYKISMQLIKNYGSLSPQRVPNYPALRFATSCIVGENEPYARFKKTDTQYPTQRANKRHTLLRDVKLTIAKIYTIPWPRSFSHVKMLLLKPDYTDTRSLFRRLCCARFAEKTFHAREKRD